MDDTMPVESDSLDDRQLPAASDQSFGRDAGGGPERAVSDFSFELDRQLARGDEPQVRLAPHLLRQSRLVVDVVFFALVFGVGLVLGKFTGPPAWSLSVAARVGFVYHMTATVWLVDGQTVEKAVCGLKLRRIDGTLPSRSRRDLPWSFGRHLVGYLIADVLLLGTVSRRK